MLCNSALNRECNHKSKKRDTETQHILIYCCKCNYTSLTTSTPSILSQQLQIFPTFFAKNDINFLSKPFVFI